MNDLGYDTPYTSSAADPVVSSVIGFVYIVVLIFAVVCNWKIFVKAGRDGWKSLIPFYNSYILVSISGKPAWWFILLFIPVVNFVIWLLVAMALANKFGKSSAFGVLAMFLFPFVGFPILAFGDAQYQGDGGSTIAPAPMQTDAVPGGQPTPMMASTSEMNTTMPAQQPMTPPQAAQAPTTTPPGTQPMGTPTMPVSEAVPTVEAPAAASMPETQAIPQMPATEMPPQVSPASDVVQPIGGSPTPPEEEKQSAQ